MSDSKIISLDDYRRGISHQMEDIQIVYTCTQVAGPVLIKASQVPIIFDTSDKGIVVYFRCLVCNREVSFIL